MPVDLAAFPAPLLRADLARLAGTARDAGRLDDAYALVKALVRGIADDRAVPDAAERALIVAVCEAAITTRAGAWHAVVPGDSLLQTYAKQLEDELSAVCQDLLDLLTNLLVSIPASPGTDGNLEALLRDVLDLLTDVLAPITAGRRDEHEIVCRKLRGDAWSALADLDPAGAQRAVEDYDYAYRLAREKLPSTHPIRLGVALNYAVCTYERLKEHKKAIELAKEAFDDAISKLDQLDEATYAVSTELMQLLRDNLTRWPGGPG